MEKIEEEGHWTEESSSCPLGLGGELDGGFEDKAQGQTVGLLSQTRARAPVLRPPPTFRDSKFLGAFIAHFLLVLTLFMIAGARAPSEGVADELPGLISHWRPTLTCMAVAAPFGILGLAKCLVHFPMLRSFLVGQSLAFMVFVQLVFGVEIVAFCLGATPLAAILLMIGALNMRHVGKFKDQKQFGIVLLETVRAMVGQYPQIQTVFVMGVVMYGLFALVWVQMLLALVMGARSVVLAIGWMILMSLSLFWTAQTISRLMGMVMTGTLVSYYFNLEANAEHSVEKHHSGTWFNSTSLPWAFLRNGAGYSLGTVCKAALFAPFAQQMPWSKINSKNIFLQKTQETAKKYAKFSKSHHELSLVHVALYCKTLRRSAQDVWASVDRSGLEPVLQSDFSKKILQWLAVAPGLGIPIFLTTFQLHFRGLSWLLLTLAGALILVLGFCIAVQPFQAAMNCIYLQFAENPEMLSHCETSAMIYARIARIAEFHQDSHSEDQSSSNWSSL